jgi:hypothetical protein
MRSVGHAVVVAVLALLGAVLLGLSATMSTAVQLLASNALNGTQVPVFNITTDQAIGQLAIQYGGGHGVASPVNVVNYPASLRPLSPGGLFSLTWNQSVAIGVAELQIDTAGDPAPVIFGYSQGAVVGSEYKRAWNQQPLPGTGVPKFVFIGNGDRPDGGVLARIAGLYLPILDLTATPATPTETAGSAPGQITTYDISGQYDSIADLPTNPLNPFSLADAALGTLYVHLNYANLRPNSAELQDQCGDTAFYLIPTYPVPLLEPVQIVPIVGPIVADMLDPAVRELVESGYDRTISPGQPTAANFTYFPDPVRLGGNLLRAIPTGLDNGLQDIGLGRPLETTRPQVGPGTTGQGAYGIGGPPVTLPDNATATSAPLSISSPAPASPNETTTSSTTTTAGSRHQRPHIREPVGGSPPSGVRTSPLSGVVDALKHAFGKSSPSTTTTTVSGGTDDHDTAEAADGGTTSKAAK